MTYRIELLFVGDAPDGELERAKILAHPDVTASIKSLSSVLEQAGFEHVINARTVRGAERKRKAPADLTPGPITFVPHRADAAE